MTNIRLTAAGLGLVVLCLIPLGMRDEFVLHNLVLILLFVGLTVAWNIPTFGGIISLGHAGFFGLGAYADALLFIDFDVSPWVGMLAAMALASFGALLMSIPLLRLRGPFFTLATIAFGEVLLRLAIYARGLTRGSEGVTVPSKPGWLYMSFVSRLPYYYIALGMVVIAIAISVVVYHSRIGYHLRAAASDDDALRALGVASGRIKVFALTVSAAITGAFGAFAAQYFFVVDPDTVFSFTIYSVQPALNGIIGGMGTVVGPVVGAVLMTPLGEGLRTALSGSHQGLSFIIYGALLILAVRVLPGGIVNGWRRLWSTSDTVRQRLRHRTEADQPTGSGVR